MEYKIRSVVVKHPGGVPILYLSSYKKVGFPPGSYSLRQDTHPEVMRQQMVTLVMTNATVIIIVIMDSILFSFN